MKKNGFVKKKYSSELTIVQRWLFMTQMRMFAVMVYIGYILGLIAMGLGIRLLLTRGPDYLNFSIAMMVIGIFLISVSFFSQRLRKDIKKSGVKNF